jgi:hypothetical protein
MIPFLLASIAEVRYWHKADIATVPNDVWFWSKADIAVSELHVCF